jgi:hypothetical protein
MLVTALRRGLYPLLALPLNLTALVLGLAGRDREATTVQRPLRWSQPDTDPHGDEPTTRKLVRYALLTLPINLVAFAVAGYLWLLLPANLGYPMRRLVDENYLDGAWGGPSLAGAWATHAAGAVVVFALFGLPILNALAWVQGRLARLLL